MASSFVGQCSCAAEKKKFPCLTIAPRTQHLAPDFGGLPSQRRTNSALRKVRHQPQAKASGMNVNGSTKTNHATDFSPHLDDAELE